MTGNARSSLHADRCGACLASSGWEEKKGGRHFSSIAFGWFKKHLWILSSRWMQALERLAPDGRADEGSLVDQPCLASKGVLYLN